MTFTLEERKILDDPTIPNDYARGLALEKLRSAMTATPPGPPEWAPAVAGELRSIVDEMRRAGSDILACDAKTEELRGTLEETRAKIRQLEVPATVPTLEMAREFSALKHFDVLLSNYLSGADARRSILTGRVWANVQRLTRRLYECTGRSNWDSFDDKNIHRPENVHAAASRELERVLSGQPDAFDLMNQNPGQKPNFIR